MPRPKPFTEAIREQRRQRQREVEAAAFRRAADPTKSEIEQDISLATELVAVLGLPRVRPDLRPIIVPPSPEGGGEDLKVTKVIETVASRGSASDPGFHY
jgi:hypothetical protein